MSTIRSLKWWDWIQVASFVAAAVVFVLVQNWAATVWVWLAAFFWARMRRLEILDQVLVATAQEALEKTDSYVNMVRQEHEVLTKENAKLRAALTQPRRASTP